MGDLIRSHDWSSGSLGAIQHWPSCLKTAVNIMLQSPVPMVMLWGPDGIMLYNDAYSVFAGGRHPQLLGTKVLEGWPEVAEFNRNVMKHGMAGETLSYQDQKLTLYRHGEPEPVWMDLNYSPILDEKGQPTGVLAVVTETTQRVLAEQALRENITEQQKTEAALRESEVRFRTIADSSPLFVWISGPDGQAHYVNKTWADFLGMSAEDAVAYGLKEIMDPKEQAIARAEFLQAFAKREPYVLECRMRRWDNVWRWILNKSAPLFLPNGELIGYIGTSIDITDRKEAEERLQNNLEQEKLIRRVMEIISESFDIDKILLTVAETVRSYLDADRCGITRYVITDGELSVNLSAQACKAGCKEADPEDMAVLIKALSKLNLDVFANEQEQIVNISDQKIYLEHLRERMASMFPDGLPGLTTDGLVDMVRKYDVQSSLRVNIFYRGTPYGSFSVSQCSYNRIWQSDEVELIKTIAEHVGSAIYQSELYRQAQETALKEKQSRQEIENYTRRLEASNKELEQFATIASHDLSEPLRKLQMFSEILKDKVSEDGKDYLNRMNNAASRMQTLMDDLLALSRVNRKGQPFQHLDLNHLVRTVLDDMQIMILESGAQVSVAELACVQADESQMRQLFQNLIGNAIKYQRENVPPVVTIEAQLQDHVYQIMIQDNGLGIKVDQTERIFEPFQRLHTMDKYPGTGMGLAIVKKIMDRHDGQISVRSTLGQGSEFIISLPVPDESEPS
jgi:PAS domain S-box-containing protein